MADVDKVLREHTTEPYIVIQFGDPVPQLDGSSYIPSILSFGNGMDPVTAVKAIVECAFSLLSNEAEVHAFCDDPEHNHRNIREEMLHARREPPYGG